MDRIIRNNTCWQCEHRGRMNGKKCYCNITKRYGNLVRGKYCDKFQFNKKEPTMIDGVYVKNTLPEDYRTEKQWLEVGRKVKADSVGVEMHPNRMSYRVCKYYLIDDTEIIEGEDLC